jgi:manganese/zinc/iron transport system permease protein
MNFKMDTSLSDIFVYPWTEGFSIYGWIILGGFLTAAACSIVGNFLILRRMALMGDAISHSVLPGLVGSFLITDSRGAIPMILGALVAGVATTFGVELIHRQSRVKPDAALGIVFSTLFALGVVMLSLYAGHVDMDAECVLYGEIAFLPLAPAYVLKNLSIPWPIIHLLILFAGLGMLVSIFYKPLLITSFDPALARSMGIPVKVIHYALMLALAIVTVVSLGLVGVVLVVSMLILPGVTANLVSHSLPRILLLSLVFSALYAVVGLHLALWLRASIAASMAVVAVMILVLVHALKVCVLWIRSKKTKTNN